MGGGTRSLRTGVPRPRDARGLFVLGRASDGRGLDNPHIGQPDPFTPRHGQRQCVIGDSATSLSFTPAYHYA